MLTGKQKRHLRALGHALKPVILIGKGEITEPLLKETVAALESHELIKVKVLESCLLGREEASEELATATSSEVAQLLGRTFLLYLQAKKPIIELPTEKKAKAKVKEKAKPKEKEKPKSKERTKTKTYTK